MLTCLCQNDRSVHVVVQALLEHPATQIIRLSLYDLLDGSAQIPVCYLRLASFFGKPRRLERSNGDLRLFRVTGLNGGWSVLVLT